MEFSRRKLMQGSAALGLLSLGDWVHGSAVPSWKALTIGGGGFADSISQSTDGVTTICRNDSGHAYIRNVAQNQWTEITTIASIPSPYNTTGSMTTEVVVAPSNNQIIYLLFNGLVFKSTNAGTSFGAGPLAGFNNGNALDPSSVSSNDAYRLSNYKMAVDPINPNVLFVGTGVDGLWTTPDGGTTWSLVPVPVSVPGLLTGATITATGGATNVITTASGGAAAPIGYFAYDQTNPAAIPPNTTVIGKTATTVTLSGSTTAASVANGDVILFFNFNVLRATAAGSGSTITCANGTGTAVSNGMYVFDFTNPSALAVGTKVSTFTGTTLNLSSSAASVASGDLLLVGNPSTFVSNNPNYCIAFDPSSAQSGSPPKTQGLYVYGNGSRIQHSINGGTSFTPASSGPTTPPKCLRVNPAGLVWVASGNADFAAGNTNLWSGSGTTFTQYTQATISSASFVGTLAVSPHINGGGHYPVTLFASTNPLNMSVDDGANWLGTWNGPVAPNYFPNPTPAQAIAWLNIPTTPSAGCAMYDNVSTTLMWMADGVGTHYADPFPTSRVQYTWFENTFGMENLVVTDILCPPGSSMVLVPVQDRQIFQIPTPGIAPAHYVPTNIGINPCQSIDYVPGTLYVAAYINGNNSISCYSIDGGNNFTVFSTMPASLGNSGTGGVIACSTYTSTTNANLVMAGGTTAFYYTTDNGSGTSGGWQASSGLPAPSGITNGTGLRVLAADRVQAGYFYLYGHTTNIFYRSIDGGATWNPVYTGNPSGSGLTIRLRALPGIAGTILFNASTVLGTGTLQICINALTGNPLVWNNINVLLTNVVDFGFGAIAPGKTYPTIFVIGQYSSQPGFWTSQDLGATWQQLLPVQSSANPLGHIAQWSCVGSDMNHYNRMFIGTSNDGAYWYS